MLTICFDHKHFTSLYMDISCPSFSETTLPLNSFSVKRFWPLRHFHPQRPIDAGINLQISSFDIFWSIRQLLLAAQSTFWCVTAGGNGYVGSAPLSSPFSHRAQSHAVSRPLAVQERYLFGVRHSHNFQMRWREGVSQRCFLKQRCRRWNVMDGTSCRIPSV